MSNVDCDAVIVGSGPAGATAAEVLTAAGWSVIMLEKGRNHLLDLEPPFGPAGEVSNDEIKFTRRHFLGPDPLLEPRTYRNRDDEEPATSARRTTCRRRWAVAGSTPTASSRAFARTTSRR